MSSAILVTPANCLGRTGQRAINGIQVNQEVREVLNELFLILKRLPILHSDLHSTVHCRILGSLQSADSITQLRRNGLIRAGSTLASLNTGHNRRILCHEINFAGQHTTEERTGSHQAVNLIGAFKDALDTCVAIGLFNGVLLHEAIAAEDLYTLVNDKGQHFAAMNFGDRSFDGILFNGFESSLGIISAAPCLLDVGSGTEDLALGGIGLCGHTSQLLLDHPERTNELAKGFAFGSVGSSQAQCRTRSTYSACSQLQTPDIEDVEGDLIAFVNLAQQVLHWNLCVFKVDLARRRALDAHLALLCARRNAGPVSLNDEGRGFLIADTSEGDHYISKASVRDPLLGAIED